MTANHLTLRLLLCLFAISMSMVGCSSNVRLTSTGNPLLTRAVDLQTVSVNYGKIKSNTASCAEVEAYNEEVRAAAAQLVKLHSTCRNPDQVLRTNDGDTRFRLKHNSIRNFDRIDSIAVADTIVAKAGVEETVESFGAGVPLLARVLPDKKDTLVPEKGFWIPLTAVMEPGRQCQTIRLIDTSSPRCEVPYPVATNYTAPLIRDFADRQQEFRRGGALFNFDKFAPSMGIKRVFDFHPQKTPVVFVHGIFSSSSTWIILMNQLMKDPEIRCKYEFWTYEYPTGAPIPYLALHLREDIEMMQKFRRSRGATCSDVIMVGHSMGGLMSKTLTQHSGDAQWNRFFELPVEQLDVPDDERELLKKMFYFEPVPCVKRVIFTATPHSGADAVDRSIVKLAEQFIQTPQILLGATRNILHQSAHALTPLGVEINHDFPNSIEHMRYGSEMGDIFADIPLNPRVKYHSLMGSKKGLDVPKDEMTDGIVSYSSAHIDGVESEKIIASDHGVQRNPAGIAEIARILKSAR